MGFGGQHRRYISLNSGGKGGVLLAAPPRPPDSADSREEHVKESDRDGRYESTVGDARDSRLRATGSRDGSCHFEQSTVVVICQVGGRRMMGWGLSRMRDKDEAVCHGDEKHHEERVLEVL